MFVSEHFLRNGTLAFLNRHEGPLKWINYSAVLTHRALYIFQSKYEWLSTAFIRINLDDEKAYALEKGNFIPSDKQCSGKSFYIGLHNFKTDKKKLFACNTQEEQLCWVREINMAQSYLAFENYTKENSNKDNGFYLNWILGWEYHHGLFEVADPELITEGNEKSMEQFVKNNVAVNGFSLSNVPISEEIISALDLVLTSFNNKQILSIKFVHNDINSDIMAKLHTSISHQEYLETLEITHNFLDSNSLNLICRLFPYLPSLENLILHHNKITKDKLDFFFERIQEELELKILDLSFNLLDDGTLRPIIKYILRSLDCTINKVILTGNLFSSIGIKSLYKAMRLSKKATENKKKIEMILNAVPFTEENIKEVLKSYQKEDIEIVRKPMGAVLKEIPVIRKWKDLISSKEQEITNLMNSIKEGEDSSGPSLEDIYQLLKDIESLSFEFPMGKLEKVYNYVEKTLQIVMHHDNIYCLEILMDCAKILGMDNLRAADERLFNLSKRAQKVSDELLKVLNMECADDNEINGLLDKSLKEADKLGLRGDLIDTCLQLQEIRDDYVKDFHKQNMEDFDLDNIVFSDEEGRQKIDDVFDPAFEQYLELTPLDLGLTMNEDCNLGFHPWQADYIAISQLRPERVRLNQQMADMQGNEDSYAHKNINDRALFLLCSSFSDPSWALSRNDNCLKIARIIFRYRNNLNKEFKYVKPQSQIQSFSFNVENPPNPEKKFAENPLSAYPELRPIENFLKSVPEKYRKDVKDSGQLTFYPEPLKETLIPQGSMEIEKELLTISKMLYQLGTAKELSNVYSVCKGVIESVLRNDQNFSDEIFLQLYRQSSREQPFKLSPEFYERSIILMNILSCYKLPSEGLIEPLRYWLYIELRNHNNLLCHERSIKELIARSEAKSQHIHLPFHYWVPSTWELESHFTSNKLQIKLFFGERNIKNIEIEPYLTVRHLMNYFREKTDILANEPDRHLYWLYKMSDNKNEFDKALPNEANICYLLSKWENKPSKSSRISVESENKTDFVLKRRIYHSGCRFGPELKNLSSQALKQLYFQCMHDYIHLGVLDILPKQEDVYKMAAYILKNRLKKKQMQYEEITKEILTKHFENTIPVVMRNDHSIEEWYKYIIQAYRMEKIKELNADDSRREFIKVYAKYNIAMSSYFRSVRTGPITAMQIPINSFCVVNVKGIFFYPEIGRKEVSLSIKYEDVISVAGYKKDFKIVIKHPELEQKMINASLRVKRAREMAEDIISYAQIYLSEYRYCSWIQPIEVKRRLGGKSGKDMSDSGLSDIESDIGSRYKDLPSLSDFGGDIASVKNEKVERKVLSKDELEKYIKHGIKHYEIKEPFLMFEQAFPLHLSPELNANLFKEYNSAPEEEKFPSPLFGDAIPNISVQYKSIGDDTSFSQLKKENVSKIMGAADLSSLSRTSGDEEIRILAGEIRQPDNSMEHDESRMTFFHNVNPRLSSKNDIPVQESIQLSADTQEKRFSEKVMEEDYKSQLWRLNPEESTIKIVEEEKVEDEEDSQNLRKLLEEEKQALTFRDIEPEVVENPEVELKNKDLPQEEHSKSQKPSEEEFNNNEIDGEKTPSSEEYNQSLGDSIDKDNLHNQIEQMIGPDKDKQEEQLQSILAGAIGTCPIDFDESSDGNEFSDYLENDPYFNH